MEGDPCFEESFGMTDKEVNFNENEQNCDIFDRETGESRCTKSGHFLKNEKNPSNTDSDFYQ